MIRLKTMGKSGFDGAEKQLFLDGYRRERTFGCRLYRVGARIPFTVIHQILELGCFWAAGHCSILGTTNAYI